MKRPQEIKNRDLPDSPDSLLPMQGARVQFLVREPRSHMPQAWQKKKKKRGKKLKIELPHDPTIPLLGICAELKPSFLSKWSVLSFPTYPLARSPCPSLYSHCPWAWVLRNHLLMGLNSPEQSESCRSPGISINKESLPPPTGHLGKGLHSHPVSSSCCLDSNENVPRAGSTAMILSNDHSMSDIAPGTFKTSCLNIQQSLNEAGVMLMYSYRKRKTQRKERKNGQLVTAKSGLCPRFPGPTVGLSSVLEKGREAV